MSSQRYISDTLKQKKKKVKKIKASIYIFLVTLSVASIIYLLCIPQIQISKVNVTGNLFVRAEEIEQKAQNILSEKILFIIPKKNIFLFPKQKLVDQIKQNPAVIDVKVTKDLFDTLNIEITEQEKEALYCNSYERTVCFFLNKEGFIYSQVSDMVIPEQEIIIYLETSQKQIKEFVVDTSLYINIMTFIKSSARQGITIRYVTIKPEGIVEFHTDAETRIITSQYDDFEKDFSNFMALFTKNVLTKETLGQIEYIDLRFGNKVFYKNRVN